LPPARSLPAGRVHVDEPCKTTSTILTNELWAGEGDRHAFDEQRANARILQRLPDLGRALDEEIVSDPRFAIDPLEPRQLFVIEPARVRLR